MDRVKVDLALMGYGETVNAVTPAQYEAYREKLAEQTDYEPNETEVFLATNIFDVEHVNFSKLNPEE
jgi:hypothetical protein